MLLLSLAVQKKIEDVMLQLTLPLSSWLVMCVVCGGNALRILRSREDTMETRRRWLM